MLEAGYSPATAKNPINLTESKAWEEFLNDPELEAELQKVGREGLAAFKVSSSLTEPDKVVPDFEVRRKYWETFLELKGRKKKESLLPPGSGFVIAWSNPEQ